MPATNERRGVTRTGVAVLLAVFVLALAVLFPYVQVAREAANRATCDCHMKQIGLAIQNYNSVYGRLPSNGEIVPIGKEKHVGGWSFVVKVLPYLDCTEMYDRLKKSGWRERR